MEPQLTLKQARDLLQVGPDVDVRTLRRAWVRVLKAARPERHGGDERPYRVAIAAHRLLATAIGRDDFVLPPAPYAPPPPADLHCELIVSPQQALEGVWRVLRIGGRAFRVRVPAGSRQGLVLRLARQAPGGADLLVRLRVPQPAPQHVETVHRRFSAAWAA